jgi:hypothetical protein
MAFVVGFEEAMGIENGIFSKIIIRLKEGLKYYCFEEK